MLGKDLIIYILQNGLENEPVYEDGRLLGFMNVIEAAIKFDVGAATIDAWVKMGELDFICIGNMTYIPANAKDPRERISDEKNIITSDDFCHVVDGLRVPKHFDRASTSGVISC